MTKLSFHEVTEATWKDFEALFESTGAPKSCWCMVWRATSEESKRTDGKSRKAMMKKRVKAGTPVGILAYAEGEPIGWCSVAPRDTYRASMAGNFADDETRDAKVWSIVCFFVVRVRRSTGVMKALVAAARKHAKAKGAKIVEAYPVDPKSPSYRFGGFVGAFEEAGFTEVGQVGTRRHVMRAPLVPAKRLVRARG